MPNPHTCYIYVAQNACMHMGRRGSDCMACSAAAAAVRRHKPFRVMTSVLCTHRSWVNLVAGGQERCMPGKCADFWPLQAQRPEVCALARHVSGPAANAPRAAMPLSQGGRLGQTSVLSVTTPAPTLCAKCIETSCCPETGMPMHSRPDWAHSCTLLSTSNTALWYSSANCVL